MHHDPCMTHGPWCMPGSLTSGFLWSRWREKRSRHSRRMRNPQLCVSGKRSMPMIEATASKAHSDEKAFNSTAFMFQCTIVYLRHWQPRVLVMPIMSLAATTVTTGCHGDNLWCHQWQQNWHMPNISFSVRRAIPSCDIDVVILCSSASGRLIAWAILIICLFQCG